MWQIAMMWCLAPLLRGNQFSRAGTLHREANMELSCPELFCQVRHSMMPVSASYSWSWSEPLWPRRRWPSPRSWTPPTAWWPTSSVTTSCRSSSSSARPTKSVPWRSAYGGTCWRWLCRCTAAVSSRRLWSPFRKTYRLLWLASRVDRLTCQPVGLCGVSDRFEALRWLSFVALCFAWGAVLSDQNQDDVDLDPIECSDWAFSLIPTDVGPSWHWFVRKNFFPPPS